jgi:hypothetical protein
MKLVESDGLGRNEPEFVERRKINWRAIFAGSVATLGALTWFMYLGSAIGLSTFHADRAATFSDAAVWGPVLYIFITGVLSTALGAFITGHWANLYSAEDAYMHGGVMWGFSAIILAFGIALTMGLTSSATQAASEKAMNTTAARGQEKGAEQAGSLAYDRLNDPKFAGFVADQAKAFASKTEGTPINTAYDKASDSKKTMSADKSHQVEPKKIANDYELQRFVMTEAGLSKDAAQNFLKEQQQPIAQAAADSQRQWEIDHARDIAKAENARRNAADMAWTLSAVGLITLACALAASYAGWRERYGDIHDDELPPENVEVR